MKNIYSTLLFIILGIGITSECLYSAERRYRPVIALPATYIPSHELNNEVYVKTKSLATPVVVRYFTKDQCCSPGSYFTTENIISLANCNGTRECNIERKADKSSLITFECKGIEQTYTLPTNKWDTFFVNPEYQKTITITKNGTEVVAQFTLN